MKLVINICSQHLQEFFCWDKKPFDLMENMSTMSKSCGQGSSKTGGETCVKSNSCENTCFALFFSTTLCGYFHPVFWCKSETEGETCVRTNSREKTSFCFHPDFWHKSKTEGETRVRTNFTSENHFVLCSFFSFSPPCVLIFILTFDFIFSFGIIFSKASPR